MCVWWYTEPQTIMLLKRILTVCARYTAGARDEAGTQRHKACPKSDTRKVWTAAVGGMRSGYQGPGPHHRKVRILSHVFPAPLASLYQHISHLLLLPDMPLGFSMKVRMHVCVHVCILSMLMDAGYSGEGRRLRALPPHSLFFLSYVTRTCAEGHTG